MMAEKSDRLGVWFFRLALALGIGCAVGIGYTIAANAIEQDRKASSLSLLRMRPGWKQQ